MMRFIDSFLNRITMYKLVLIELIFLILVAMGLSFFGILPYNPFLIAYSALFILIVGSVTNAIFAYFFEAQSNPDSGYITALILALIITPPTSLLDTNFIVLGSWAAAWAIASKYIFAIKEKHIFNPAAIGIAVPALFLGVGASWWVGTLWMLPFVAVGGFLVTRKIHRFDVVITFGAMLVATIVALNLGEGSGALHIVQQTLLYAPALFFGTVMLTEPLTAPTMKYWRVMYAVLVGFLFAPSVHFGPIYLSPEEALLIGNVFAYFVGSKKKLRLILKEKIEIAADTYEFVFAPNQALKFKAGQYLEWTLAHPNADFRGIRRYFTIASSPDDSDIRVGVKFYKPMSSFKKALLALPPGGTVMATQLSGDFVLPENTKRKLVFIAGGIGITPFRSMIQDLIDRKEHRDIILIYSNKTIDDTAYVELLGQAEREIGLQTLPIFTNPPPNAVAGEYPSKLDQALMMAEVPDYMDRDFYISGPHGMVNAFSDILSEMDVPRGQIKKDFFPGFV
jgi:ferredoxin-NADP reductase